MPKAKEEGVVVLEEHNKELGCILNWPDKSQKMQKSFNAAHRPPARPMRERGGHSVSHALNHFSAHQHPNHTSNQSTHPSQEKVHLCHLIYLIYACFWLNIVDHSLVIMPWCATTYPQAIDFHILLQESPCSLVRPPARWWQNLPHHRYMHHTYMYASGPRSRIIDMCIIHTHAA